MKEIIDIIRQQLVLISRLLELTRKQKKNIVGADVESIKQLTPIIEPIVIKLNTLEKRQQTLLGKSTSVADWLKLQPNTIERQMAEKLLIKLKEQLSELKQIETMSLELVKRANSFVDYNLNVMTQTSAGVTYGTPKNGGGRPVQGKSMFEANI